MPQIKTYFAAAVVLLVLICCALFAFVFWKVQPPTVEQELVKKVEAATNGNLTYNKFDFSYFPRPHSTIRDVSLTVRERPGDLFKAERVDIHLQILPLLFGKAEIGGIKVRDGEVETVLGQTAPIRQLKLDRLQMKIGALKVRKPLKVEFRGALAGVEETLSGKMKLVFSQFETWHFIPEIRHARVYLRNFPLERLGDQLDPLFPVQVRGGILSAEFQLEQSRDVKWLDLRSTMTLQNFVYQTEGKTSLLTSLPMNGTFQTDMAWNPDAGELKIRRSVLDMPAGKVELGGRAFIDTGELQDVRIRATELALESLPQYYVKVQEMIPYHIGFSGKSGLEMSLSGTLDHLSLQGNWDLGSSLLTYGGFFSKPKESPLDFSFDFLLREGKFLSGDFSLGFESAQAKGTLSDVNLALEEGQINIITNKFPLVGLEKLIPPLQEYDLGGKIKILFNLRGNFRDPKKLERMLNLTVEDARMIRRGDQSGIQNANILMDYGSLALKIKQARFEIGGAPIGLSVTVYNLNEAPIAKGKMSSTHIVPGPFMKAVEDLFKAWISDPSTEKRFSRARRRFLTLLPEDEPLEGFSMDFGYKKGHWSIPDLRFETCDGWVELQADFETGETGISYRMDTEINRLSLARYFSGRGAEEPRVDGKFFLKASLRGEDLGKEDWIQKLTGSGECAVANGEFHTFDILRAAGQIAEVGALRDLGSGTTPFDDVRATFSVGEGKATTEDLVLLSRDLSLQAQGDVSFDGVINFRTDVFLSGSVTREVLGSFLGNVIVSENKQLGPMPLLVAGPFEDPEVKPDPALLPQFRSRLLKKDSREIFQSFLPEDFFFERKTSS